MRGKVISVVATPRINASTDDDPTADITLSNAYSAYATWDNNNIYISGINQPLNFIVTAGAGGITVIGNAFAFTSNCVPTFYVPTTSAQSYILVYNTYDAPLELKISTSSSGTFYSAGTIFANSSKTITTINNASLAYNTTYYFKFVYNSAESAVTSTTTSTYQSSTSGGTSSGGGCFEANTKVLMSDGSYKKIIDVKKDDMVMSYDYKETGLFKAQKVLDTFVIEDYDNLITVELDGNRCIHTTNTHPFLSTDG